MLVEELQNDVRNATTQLAVWDDVNLNPNLNSRPLFKFQLGSNSILLARVYYRRRMRHFLQPEAAHKTKAQILSLATSSSTSLLFMQAIAES